MDTESIALINDLNQQRAANPRDPVIARRWCLLALRLGQYDKVKRRAAQFYSEQGAPLRLAEWSRLSAQAAFHELRLEEALAAYTVSLMHLCDACDDGRLLSAKPQPVKTNLFSDGTAEILLWATTSALAQTGINAFPYAGTLLGLVREGRLLAADKDIDLGVWAEDFDACCHWLAREGWVPIPGMHPYSTFRAFLHRATHLTLDIYSFQAIPEERIVSGGFRLEGYPAQYQSIRVFPWFELESRATPTGESSAWFIKKPEIMLAALYGDWLTPNPWWDGMVSSLCFNEHTLLTRCYAYDRLLARWSDGQIERAWAYAHQILLKDEMDFVAIRAKKSLSAVLSALNPLAMNWPPVSTEAVLLRPPNEVKTQVAAEAQ